MMRSLVALAAAAASEAAPVYAGVQLGPGGKPMLHTDTAPLAPSQYAAYGKYTRDTLNTSGWAYLEIHTNSSFSDADSAYAAGYLEGFLSNVEIGQFAVNAHGGNTGYSDDLASYVSANLAYVKFQAQSNPTDPFWYQVGLTMAQFQGLYDGYANATPASARFSQDVIYSLTLVGDLDDLCPAYGCTSGLGAHTCSSKSECEADAARSKRRVSRDRTLHGEGHCSILVKPLGYVQAPTDIIFGHTTWSPYTLMGPRVMKLYDFAFRQSSSSSNVVPGQTIAFTSYPAVLYSFDDWYTISSGLTVSETTIINNNPDLWKAVQPNSVLIWSRAMVANRLATTGQSWTEIAAIENSGTYNNAWHIVDWNVWSPGQPIPDGFLWQTEQMPGVMKPIDLSPVLRSQTYWASYNRVYDAELFNLTGQWQLVQEYGPHYTWDQTSRAQIFRRNQSMVVDMKSYQAMLRYNNFEQDSLSGQGCTSGYHSASNAISERGDLSPATGCAIGGSENEGGIDCKVTSWSTLAQGKHKNLRMLAQVGPTYDQQPVYRWSGSPFHSYSHLGQPDEWAFPWVDVDDVWT